LLLTLETEVSVRMVFWIMKKDESGWQSMPMPTTGSKGRESPAGISKNPWLIFSTTWFDMTPCRWRVKFSADAVIEYRSDSVRCRVCYVIVRATRNT
jgi:hypothetical protein